MEATRPREQARSAADAAEPGDQIFRKYYTDKDYISSLEGVLKVLSAPLAVLNAGMVIASAVTTYVAVMQLWDASSPPQPPRAPPSEHDV